MPRVKGQGAGRRDGDHSEEHRADLQAADIAGTMANILAHIHASDQVEILFDRRLDAVIANLESYRDGRKSHNADEDRLHKALDELLPAIQKHRDNLLVMYREADERMQARVAALADEIHRMMSRFEATVAGAEQKAA